MTNTNITTYSKIVAAGLFMLAIMLSGTVSAFAQTGTTEGGASSIEADFERVPMFMEVNFVPGEHVSRYADIRNTSNQGQRIYVRAANEILCPNPLLCISDRLIFTITDASRTYFTGTLTEFYSRDAVSLGTLGAGAERRYTFRVFFEPESSNLYQNQTTGFNMIFAFEGEPGGVIDNPPPTGGGGGGGGSGGGGGGGGGGGPIIPGQQLEIRNVRVTDIDPIRGTARVRWETNLPATSRVVYGLLRQGPYSINITLPNYGYPFSSNFFTELTTEHNVLLTGLVAGETYVYRVASQLSTNALPTVSLEYSFTLIPGGGGPGIPPGGSVPGGGGSGPGRAPGEEPTEGTPPDVPVIGEGEEKTDDRNLAAVIFGLPESWADFFTCLALLLLILILGFLVWKYWAAEYTAERYPSQQLSVRRDAFAILWSLLALCLALLFKEFCLWLPLLIVIIVSGVNLYLTTRK